MHLDLEADLELGLTLLNWLLSRTDSPPFMLLGLLMDCEGTCFSFLFEKNRFLDTLPVSEARGENTLIPLYRLCRSKARLFLGCVAEPSVSLFFMAAWETVLLSSCSSWDTYESSFYCVYKFYCEFFLAFALCKHPSWEAISL